MRRYDTLSTMKVTAMETMAFRQGPGTVAPHAGICAGASGNCIPTARCFGGALHLLQQLRVERQHAGDMGPVRMASAW